jgi:hypothetical protein
VCVTGSIHSSPPLFRLFTCQVLFNKSVWGELLAKGGESAAGEALLEVATHPKASRVLLHLLAPHKASTFLNQVSSGRNRL